MKYHVEEISLGFYAGQIEHANFQETKLLYGKGGYSIEGGEDGSRPFGRG
jgi:hypothetical protein